MVISNKRTSIHLHTRSYHDHAKKTPLYYLIYNMHPIYQLSHIHKQIMTKHTSTLKTNQLLPYTSQNKVNVQKELPHEIVAESFSQNHGDSRLNKDLWRQDWRLSFESRLKNLCCKCTYKHV